jgi:NADH-quinone oxidoreductase subunit M
MTDEGFLLNLVLWLPAAWGLVLLFMRGDDEAERRLARNMSLGMTAFVFVLSAIVFMGFNPDSAAFQYVTEVPWLGPMEYKIGVDGISILFVMLTTMIMPLVILASWHVDKRLREYLAAFLILETLMIGVFVSLDLFLFYLFFEAGLIPMFLIIGIWGGQRRIYASFKFFLYTLLGSVLMLIAMLWLVIESGTSDIVDLLNYSVSSEPITVLGYDIAGGAQTLCWFAFFASFAVKMPMWPVHTWLPDAHVEAPTAGSVVLAAILLKLGGYGFIRFNLPMFPVASDMLADFVFFLSVVAIIYTSLVALMQEDIKKLIAYSSVAHMGFVTMGIFSANQQGVDGAIFQMISHGFISGALFLCVGVIYDRMHTREIKFYGGLVTRMPIFAAIFLLFTMGNVGLPGTSGFVGEFLTMMGAFKANTYAAFFAATGVILSAGYALWLYRRVVFGTIENPALENIQDMSKREIGIMLPLIAATLFFGIYANAAIDVFSPSVASLLDGYYAAVGTPESIVIAAGEGAPVPASSH